MAKCRSKHEIECFYLTKENKYKYLCKLESEFNKNDSYFITKENDDVVEINMGLFVRTFFYNHWYVFNYSGYYYECYSDEDFKRLFELVKED